MHTKADAEAKLAALPLERAVAVADVTDAKGAARRRYAFTDKNGNGVEVEIDAEPTDAQLSDLATHLPLATKDKAAALAAMKAETIVSSAETRRS